MNAITIVEKICRLQKEAEEYIEKATTALQTADEFTKDLKSAFQVKRSFVCNGVAFKIEHRAIGFKPGNRDWVVLDRDITILE